MASTGEVACIGDDFEDAFLKALLSVGFHLPIRRALLSTGPVEQKAVFLAGARDLMAAGVQFFATHGTADFMADAGIEVTSVGWPSETGSPNALDIIRSGDLDLVVNIPKDASAEELQNDYLIRRASVDHGIPLITNIELARRLAQAVLRRSLNALENRSWDEH